MVVDPDSMAYALKRSAPFPFGISVVTKSLNLMRMGLSAYPVGTTEMHNEIAPNRHFDFISVYVRLINGPLSYQRHRPRRQRHLRLSAKTLRQNDGHIPSW